MEESPSETSYDEVVEMLKWNTAILIALLDHHGGMINVEKELLESIDLRKRAVRISFDEEKATYIVESGEINDAVQ